MRHARLPTGHRGALLRASFALLLLAAWSITAVGPDGVQDTARPAYRVVSEKITRVMVFEFDAQNRIAAVTGED